MAIKSVLISNPLNPDYATDGADTILLQVPAEKRYAVTVIMVCNYATPNPADDTENATVFDMHFIRSGDALGDMNKVLGNMPMAAGETFTFDTEKIIIEAGDSIKINSDSPHVLSATVSFLEL
jgi:hypothetical protein